MLYYRELPSQMAHSLFNYLIGYVMFYVRTPQTYGQEAIAGALALLWQVSTGRSIVSKFCETGFETETAVFIYFVYSILSEAPGILICHSSSS